jgi:hypothetical protein
LGVKTEALLERLLHDRYSDQLAGHGMPPHCERCYRAGWNDSSANAVRVVEQFGDRGQLENLIWDLRELAFEGFSRGWDGIDQRDKHREINKVIDAIKASLDSSDDGNAATPAARDSSDGSNLSDVGGPGNNSLEGREPGFLNAAPASGQQAGTFTEAEYRADAARVISHAAIAGRAVVVRDDGSVRVVISIPTADAPIERGLAELVENAPEPAAVPVFDVGGDG